MNNWIHAAPSPCYVVDEALLVRNLTLLRGVAERSGARILLAQKGFSLFSLYPLIAEYLSGAAASSLNEARLAAEEMRGEVHIYAPAYRDDEFAEIAKTASHVIFNSFSQWKRYGRTAAGRGAECGIRINPEYSEVATAIYDPCAPYSRLGVTLREFERAASGPDGLRGLDGLHFHTMCEQDSDTLKRTLDVVCERFGAYFHGLKWVNFGGGHHITRPGYDAETLIACVRAFSERYGVQVYLEPGEAVALNTGCLVSTVLDIVDNGMKIAILDASAACHMPDVLEMPYRPGIIGAVDPAAPDYSREAFPYVYRLGGPTCLAGDVVGDYAFAEPIGPGRRLVFTDMAHYTMVKNNTFNGVNLPSIAILTRAGELTTVRSFGYADFKSRLS